MVRIVDEAGRSYGRLTILIDLIRGIDKRNYCWCVCQCGTKILVSRTRLRNLKCKSCGCLKTEQSMDRIALLHKIQRGSKNPSWKGGHKNWGSIAHASAMLASAKGAARRGNYRPPDITAEQLSYLMLTNGDTCEICNRDLVNTGFGNNRIVVDHDHKSGRVRGLICSSCNKGLGHLLDDPIITKSATDYLIRGKNRPFVQQPALRYYGGKNRIASWIHSIAPPSFIEDPDNGYYSRLYCFGGGIGELWDWMPIAGIAETINDTDSMLMSLWSVLANPQQFLKFLRLIELTPLSECAWNNAKNNLYNDNPVIAAANLFITLRQSRMGMGIDYVTPTTRIRRGMNEQCSAWLSAVDGLPSVHARLRRVEIRALDFRHFIQAYDHPRALFYCDPTYLPSTRSSVGQYRHEMDYVDHAGCLSNRDAEYIPFHDLKTKPELPGLLDILPNIKGKFMLSGYPSVCYDTWAERYGFRRHAKEVDNKASGKKRKDRETECVWTNYG